MPSQGTDSAATSRDSGPDAGGGDGSGLPPFETSPFTDWREQLRERVKEIRARKLADKRSGDDRTAPTREQSEAAREEKLRAARDRAASVRTLAPEESEDAAAGVEAESTPAATDAPATEEMVEAEESPAAEEIAAADDSPADVEIAAADDSPADEEIAAAAREALERIQAEAASEPTAETEAATDATTGAQDARPTSGPTWWLEEDVEDEGDEELDVDEMMGPAPTDAPDFADEDLDDPVGDATLAPVDAAWRSGWDGDETDAEEIDLDEPWAAGEDLAEDDGPPVDLAGEDDAGDDRPPQDRDRQGQDDETTAGPAPVGPGIDLDRVPAWARPRWGGDAEAAQHAQAAPPDLEAIPEELKDVPIPSWALPRRSERRAPPVEAAEAAAESPVEAENAVGVESDAEAGSAATEPMTDAVEADAVDAEAPALAEPEVEDAPHEEELPAAKPRFADGRRKIVDMLPWDEAESAADAGEGDPEQEVEEPLAVLDEGRDDEDDEDEPPASSPPTGGTGGGHGDRLDDVYLVGEFIGRRDADPRPSDAARSEASSDAVDGLPLGATTRTGTDEERDPLAGLRKAPSRPAGTEPSAPPRQERPIPNLYEDDDEGVEVAPTPFRGLFEEVTGSSEPSAGEAPQRGAAAAQEPPAELELDVEPVSDEEAPSRAQLDPSAPVTDRVFSALADAMVVLALGLALGLAGASAAGTGMASFVQSAPVPFAAAWLIFAFAYGVFFVGTCGQTPGKMAMRVRVIGADRFQVGYAKATRRALLYALAALPVGLGLLPALNDPEHRALHDRLSGTRVVKA